MKTSPQAVLDALDALNEVGAPYILTGSLASTYYSVPRSTNDGDFVVEMNADQLQQLFGRLLKFFEREPQMSFETVTGKTQHKFRHRESKFLIEVFEAQMDDPHERARFERRVEGEIDSRVGFLPTAEDVIVQKLRWFKRIRRPKDREDVLSVMSFQWESLNWLYMEKWCNEHDSLELLRELRTRVSSQLRKE